VLLEHLWWLMRVQGQLQQQRQTHRPLWLVGGQHLWAPQRRPQCSQHLLLVLVLVLVLVMLVMPALACLPLVVAVLAVLLVPL
jgi:hypothetical protein